MKKVIVLGVMAMSLLFGLTKVFDIDVTIKVKPTDKVVVEEKVTTEESKPVEEMDTAKADDVSLGKQDAQPLAPVKIAKREPYLIDQIEKQIQRNKEHRDRSRSELSRVTQQLDEAIASSNHSDN